MSSMKKMEELYESEAPEKNKVLKGTLYLVATPIGNLSDLSERAIKVLSEVDFIAAEDTRNTIKLLSHIGVHKPMVSYFEHNKRERGEAILARVMEGEACALVTDAGTPAISDPGEDIVKLCIEKGVPVSSIPGCCAAVTALTLSGMFTARFTFEGFLSTAKGERKERLLELKEEKRTMIFYEAPHKLKNTLKDFLDMFGNRKIALCRELTKRNEEVLRFDFIHAIEYYRGKNEPRGEYVLVVEGMSKEEAAESAFWMEMTIPEHAAYYMEQEQMDKMDAIKAVAKDRNVAKNIVYKELL